MGPFDEGELGGGVGEGGLGELAGQGGGGGDQDDGEGGGEDGGQALEEVEVVVVGGVGA